MKSYYDQVPSQWSQHRIKFLMENCQNGAWGSEAGEDSTDAVCVRVADFEWSRLRTSFAEPTIRSYPIKQIEKLALQKGDLLIEKSGGGEKTPVGRIVAFEGDELALTSNFVARIRPKCNVCNRYLLYLIASQYMSGYSHQFIKQNTGIQNLDTSAWFANDVWLPNADIQKEIADFLDCEIARIDQLIEKKRKFSKLTSSRINSLVDNAISNPNLPRIRFENAVKRMRREVNLSEHEELTRLGLYNRGRGIFKKPAADEESMGDSNFFFVKEGDLIISGQFAWEGAVAIATAREGGCVVSHRYPVYRGKDGIKTAYILGFLRSVLGNFLLNEASRGSAGRNRPLNAWRLGKEKIPIPKLSLQKEVEKAVNFEIQLKEKTGKSIVLLEEFKNSLITEAVTGQLDVKAWKKKGGTDKRLNNIEEAMAS